MGKFHTNNIGSVGGGGRRQFKLWSASLRRIIIETVRCGTRPKHNTTKSTITEPEPEPEPEPKPKANSDPITLRSELESGTTNTTNSTTASGSDKLLDLLRLSEWSEKENDDDEEEVVKRKVDALEELKRLVKNLQTSQEENGLVNVVEGAREVRRLTKDDSQARTTLAMLGAIPPLVALLDAPPDLGSQIAALYALLNLGIGNDANKAAIVKAGAVHKMLMLIESANGSPDVDVAEAIVANFLALTALDANKPIIGSSGSIPFLIRILKDPGGKYSSQARLDALRALYNLSISILIDNPKQSKSCQSNI